MTGREVDHIVDSMFVAMYDRVRFLNNPDRIKFTCVEAETLAQSWAAYLEGKAPMDRGLELLLTLFETEPEIKKWLDLDVGDASVQMVTSRRILFLGHRMIRLLDRIVKNAAHLEDVYPVVKQLGGRHGSGGYEVPINYIKALAQLVVDEIKKQQKSDWSQEKEELWTRYMHFFVSTMEDGINKYERTNLYV